MSGFASLGLLIVAFIVGTAPEADKSDATILQYYTDSGNQTKQMVTAILAAAAVVAFLVFLTGVRLLLEEVGVLAPFPELAFVGGLVFAVLALAGLAVGTAVPATLIFSDTFELDPDTARIVLTIGNIWLLSFAGAAASLLVGAVSLRPGETTSFRLGSNGRDWWPRRSCFSPSRCSPCRPSHCWPGYWP